jgi:anti-anti-sigma factor
VTGVFAVTIALDDEPPAVVVRGTIDFLTAPALRAALQVVSRRPSTTALVLDLAAATFIDGSGLRVIVDTSAELRQRNGVLRIRSATAHTLRLLARTQVGHDAGLDGEQAASLAAHDEDGLVADLVHASSVRQGHGVVDGALRLVSELAASSIHGADGASVSLRRHGRVRTVASTDATVRRMDDHQYMTGEGPCLAASGEGRVFHIESVADDQRWPAFVPLAASEGIASILSTPLITAAGPLGALNVYSNASRAFGEPAHALAASFARHAARLVDEAAPDATDEELTARIHGSLAAREVIAHAQGLLMGRHGVDAETAAASLHRSARRAGVTVLERAAEEIEDLGHPGVGASGG